jgi:hypothetical protein
MDQQPPEPLNTKDLMDQQLPEPLNTKDCDLRGSIFGRGTDRMPLVGHQFHSHFFLTSSAEGFRAALTLWWHAWTQCPAGSLPSCDETLARFCYLVGKRDYRKWLKIRDEALHGFILCNDGRYYHPFIVELAKEEFATSARFRKRRKELEQQRQRAATPKVLRLVDGRQV